jgi:hypothetical protein
MTIRSCARERELSEVLKAGHWPEACDPTLRQHLEHCERCGELVLLTQTFKAARAETMAQGELPHPGLLWWRAQLRRRDKALERVSQPTYFVGRFAFLCALLVTLGFTIWQRHNVAGWFDWLGSMPHSGSLNLSSLWVAVSNWSLLLLVACFGSLLLFGAVALYFSSDED